MTEQELKQAWQQQPTEDFAMSEQQIKDGMTRFVRTIRIRNLMEYVAGAAVVTIFGWYFLIYPGPWVRTGCVLTILGTFYVMFQLYKRASLRRPSPDRMSVACLAFHRAELVRQRDAMRSAWAWYVMPLVPGMVVLLAGGAMEIPGARANALSTGLLVGGVFLAVAWANRLAARRAQREIDRLDRLAS